MNLDAILAFVGALASGVSSIWAPSPEIAHVFQVISGVLAVLGHAFHLDGK